MSKDKDKDAQVFSTRAIHFGYDPASHHGALNPPVYLNATYTFESIAQGQQRFCGEAPGYAYARVGNQTQSLLEKRLASSPVARSRSNARGSGSEPSACASSTS